MKPRQEGSSRDQEFVLVKRTTRDAPPADFTLTIEEYPLLIELMRAGYKDSYHQSRDFKAGGYKWRLILYPFGDNKTRKDAAYMSMHLELAEQITSHIDVNIKFFLYDQARENYLMVEDATRQVKRFSKARSAYGISELISVDSFSDPCNGFLVNEMSCTFGVELQFAEKNTSKTVCLSNVYIPPEHNVYQTWKLDNFSKRHDSVYYSQSFVAGERQWKLIMCPRWEKKWLALGIVLDKTKSSSSRKGFFRWLNRNDDNKLYAKYTLVVKDQLNHRDIAKECCDYFNEARPCKVRRNFMKLNKLNDQSKGFLANDMLVVQVQVTAVLCENTWQEG